MHAGFAESDITPPVGAWLLGPRAPSTGVHDPLFARALILDDGSVRTAILTFDLLGFDFDTVDTIRQRVAEAIEPDNLMLNCSHSHSAPFTVPWSYHGWKNYVENESEWARTLIDKVIDLVRHASESMHPVRLRSGRAPVQIGHNRRVQTEDGIVMGINPDGPVVPWVDVLAVSTLPGGVDNTEALLFSHAAHPVIVHAASPFISADFAGFAVDEIRQSLGQSVMPMFAQGCGGDINAHPLQAGLAEAECAGRELGKAAVRAVENATPVTGKMSVQSHCIDLPLEPPPPASECRALLQEAREKSEEQKQKKEDTTRGWCDRAKCLEELFLLSESPDPLPTLRFELQTVSIGNDFCLAAMTHDIFCEYQLHAERVSPYRHTISLGYTNGCESYIPTAEALELGGYEGNRFGAALAYHNRLRVEPETEQLVKNFLTKHLT